VLGDRHTVGIVGSDHFLMASDFWTPLYGLFKAETNDPFKVIINL